MGCTASIPRLAALTNGPPSLGCDVPDALPGRRIAFSAQSAYQVAGVDVQRTVCLAHPVHGARLDHRVLFVGAQLRGEFLVTIGVCLGDRPLHDDTLTRCEGEVT